MQTLARALRHSHTCLDIQTLRHSSLETLRQSGTKLLNCCTRLCFLLSLRCLNFPWTLLAICMHFDCALLEHRHCFYSASSLFRSCFYFTSTLRLRFCFSACALLGISGASWFTMQPAFPNYLPLSKFGLRFAPTLPPATLPGSGLQIPACLCGAHVV